MERTHDEELCKIINYLLCTRTSVQVEDSDDAVRINRIRAQNNRFLHEDLENQNGLGELFLGACAGSLGEKLNES